MNTPHSTPSSVSGAGGVARVPLGLRLLSVEMTTGPMLAVAVVMLGFAVLGGNGASLGLAGAGWSNPINTALTGTLYLAPLCAGASVWLCGELRRRGLLLLASTTSRGRVRPLVLRALALWLWGVGAWLVLAVVLVLRSRVMGLPDGPSWLLALLALLVLATATALGLGVAMITAGTLAAPVTAVLVFAWMFTGVYLPGWYMHLSPIYAAISYRPYLQPRLGLLAVQMLALLGLIALTTTPLVQQRLRRFSVLGLAAGVLLASGVGLAALGPASTEPRPAPAHPACTSRQGVTVCLRPLNAGMLSSAHQHLAQAVTALRPVLDTVPTRFSEPGMESPAQGGPGVFVPPATASTTQITQTAVQAVLPVAPCPHPGSERDYAHLLLWAQARGGSAALSAYDQQQLATVPTGDDPAAEKAWVAQRIARVRACAQ